MFDIKLETSGIYWLIGGGFSFIGIVTAATVKVLTRNHIHRKEAYKDFQTNKMCNERSGNLEGKIDGLSETINTRFDDLKDFIKNGNK